ncbi:hypothetical protein BC832DRAFT_314282 [Gaertneriomyces semiglobifer]|nr:hypothetical protein BC832DRAFT_314282 [Gaertneriomyces semiglobifer]
MGTLGYQSHIDFLQEPEFMRADSNRRSFDATKSAMEFSGPVSSSLRKGGPALDDFEPILRDELGLLDFEDEFDSQRVMAVSPAHSEALASSLTMSSDAMLTMSPVSKAGPATVTSTLNIGQPASESEVSGFEELIEYDEPGVVSMGGGGQDLAAMSSVREPSASGDYHIPSSSSSSSRKDSVLSREVKSIAEVKLANSTGATYEEIQNESLHESPAEPVAIGAEPEGAIPNVALGNFDSSLGSPGQDTDLIEYVEEEDEEYDDEDDALNNSPVAHHSVKEPPETADLREADLKQEGEFEYAPLPCVLLDYRGDTHALFNLYPLNLDLKPIFDEEEYGGSLFASELTYFITELKTYFEIENDVSLECPELGVVIHEVSH